MVVKVRVNSLFRGLKQRTKCTTDIIMFFYVFFLFLGCVGVGVDWEGIGRSVIQLMDIYGIPNRELGGTNICP